MTRVIYQKKKSNEKNIFAVWCVCVGGGGDWNLNQSINMIAGVTLTTETLEGAERKSIFRSVDEISVINWRTYFHTAYNMSRQKIR